MVMCIKSCFLCVCLFAHNVCLSSSGVAVSVCVSVCCLCVCA